MTPPAFFLCPVRGCGQSRRKWQAVCGSCWPLLPVDHRAAIRKARDARAKHREARAAIEATNWQNEHSPWAQAARRVGDDPP